MFKCFICFFEHEMYRRFITLTYLSLYLSLNLAVPGNKVATVLDVVCGTVAKFMGEC